MRKARLQALVTKIPTTSECRNEDVADMDYRGDEVLREKLTRLPAPMVTKKSVREGEAFMADYRAVSAAMLETRINRKELLTRKELVQRLGGNRRWVSAALKNGRLFSVQAPSGVEYFPAFFADESLSRRALGQVARVLSGLSGPSKYHFFVSKSFILRMTPLEALAAGQLKDVLTAAAGSAEP